MNTGSALLTLLCCLLAVGALAWEPVSLRRRALTSEQTVVSNSPVATLQSLVEFPERTQPFMRTRKCIISTLGVLSSVGRALLTGDDDDDGGYKRYSGHRYKRRGDDDDDGHRHNRGDDDDDGGYKRSGGDDDDDGDDDDGHRPHRPRPSPTHRPSPSPTHRPSPSPTYRPSPSPTHRPSPSPTYRPSPSPKEPEPHPEESPEPPADGDSSSVTTLKGVLRVIVIGDGERCFVKVFQRGMSYREQFGDTSQTRAFIHLYGSAECEPGAVGFAYGMVKAGVMAEAHRRGNVCESKVVAYVVAHNFDPDPHDGVGVDVAGAAGGEALAVCN